MRIREYGAVQSRALVIAPGNRYYSTGVHLLGTRLLVQHDLHYSYGIPGIVPTYSYYYYLCLI